MSLERIDRVTHREAHGFSFSMRIIGSEHIIRVFVSDDALGDRGSIPSRTGKRVQFEADEQAFEEIASDKHSHGQVSVGGCISIDFADLGGILE
jgi:hypothetical protein